jgi:hypothetical protein
MFMLLILCAVAGKLGLGCSKFKVAIMIRLVNVHPNSKGYPTRKWLQAGTKTRHHRFAARYPLLIE